MQNCGGLGGGVHGRAGHGGESLLAHGGFLQVGKEGTELVKIARGKRIKLVVVAFGATQRAGHPNGGRIAHAVGEVLGGVFFWLRAAFAGGHIQAVVAGGNFLHGSRLRNEISGDVLDDELIVGQVLIEGADDVVAIGGDLHEVIAVISRCVGKTHQIEPVDGHSFTESGIGQELIDELAIGLIGGVLEECIRFLRSWRNTK